MDLATVVELKDKPCLGLATEAKHEEKLCLELATVLQSREEKEGYLFSGNKHKN